MENNAAKKYVNGLLYQRKVQKESALARKRRQVHAIFLRQKKKAEIEKEKIEEGDEIKQKNIEFYENIFKGDENERRKPRRERKKLRKREKSPEKKKVVEVGRREKEELAGVKRIQKFKNYRKKTSKGQPIMKFRINDLFEKVKKAFEE